MFIFLKKMIKLVINEIIKNISKKNFVITFIVMILSMSLIAAVSYKSHSNNYDWKEVQKEELESLKQDISGNDQDELILEANNQKIQLLSYSLEHNIPLNVTTPWTFVYDVNGTLNLVVIIIMLLSINTINKEYSYKTIKQILIRPYNRMEILLSKHIFTIAISFIYMLLHFIMALILGYIIFSKNGSAATKIAIVNDSIIEINVIKSIAESYICFFIESIIIITFAMMIAIIIKGNIIPLILSIILWFGGSLITKYLKEYEILAIISE